MEWPLNQACYKEIGADNYFCPNGEHVITIAAKSNYGVEILNT